MRCINSILKKTVYWGLGVSFLSVSLCLSGCTKASFPVPFKEFGEEIETIPVEFSGNSLVEGFSSDLAAFVDDYKERFVLEHGESGLLIDMENKSVVFAEDAFKKMYPASITKIMTAYVALKYCSPEDLIVCGPGVTQIDVPDAVVLGLKEGDTLTLDQALHLAVPASYNDVAVAIAEHVSGSVEAFAELMTKEAQALGATGTHFANPHGLHNDEHYTTAYDIYLIFNAAVANPDLLEIMQCKQYQTTYHNRAGKEISASSTNTNYYFRGVYPMPDTVTIVGGKTGTTGEAKYCLALYVKDKYSKPYIAVILKADTRENLYKDMTDLLNVLAN